MVCLLKSQCQCYLSREALPDKQCPSPAHTHTFPPNQQLQELCTIEDAVLCAASSVLLQFKILPRVTMAVLHNSLQAVSLFP